MRITRPLAGLLSAALLGLVPLATASPAQAATYPVQVNVEASRAKATYGDSLSFGGNIVFQRDGGTYGVSAGTAYLQVSTAGAPWRTLATDTYPSTFYFSGIKATSNAVYRVYYSGGTDRDMTHPASSSVGRTVKVRRDFNERIKRLVFKGKMSPSYKRKKVTIQIKAGRWKKFRTIRTDRRSRWAIKLPARRKRTHFRAVVSGNKSFVKSVSRTAYTYRY